MDETDKMTERDGTHKDKARPVDFTETINRFAISLYHHLAEENSDVIVSPYCVSAAIALLYLGARSKTASQIKESMNWTTFCDSLPETFSSYLDVLTEKQTDYDVKVANRIFIANGFTILNDYLQLARQYLKATAEHVNFQDGGENVRNKINAWIQDETCGAVKEVLPAGTNADVAKLFLVNAVYFKGKWSYPFDKSDTQTDTFKTVDGQNVPVQMMNMKKLFPYVALHDLKCRLVELPYVNGDFSMFIFLPVQTSCLIDVEAGLNEQTLQLALDAVKPTLVHVSLPKFRTTSAYDMCNILTSMGMKDAFKDGADFSGITGTTDLHVSQFLHQTVLEVGEEGSEENEDTIRNCGPSPFRSKLVYFVVDRPFIFVVRDNQAGVVLLMGKVLKPQES